ncbi:hypothetical protein JY651_05355 [Pyxidicoccus parkwayensis]|uniref:Monooxygenase n=1 Tax=Pyxidicoccus parkwayensis TaxID=2813578 RepID=A0ABX7NZM7_9BACT|nr:hypothetical protein [Pyxidicoccus parkwaysis]QSQ24390.1 hypothetical protein JY651_05355 [Pyxidicoccus parkwaysis]
MLRPSLLRVLPGALLAVATACSGNDIRTPNDPAPPVTWHKHVAPIVQSKCANCHTEGGIGPFPLETYADVYAHRSEVRAAVQARTMPPWPPSSECNTYQHDRSLSAEQQVLLTRWVDEGATEGDPATAATTPAPVGGLSRADVVLKMPEPYLPTHSPDDYRCFIIDWPETRTRYITGFRADPGNRATVHHVIAFLAAPSEVADFESLDAASPGPGYTCFGGPGGADASRAKWLGAWAPGSLGQDFPAGTGLRIEPGSKVVLQVHYNDHGQAAASDLSSIAFKVDDTVEKVAYVQPWTNPAWVNGTKPMRIPAGTADTSHLWSLELTPYLGFTTGGVLLNNVPVTIHNAALHMHTRGTHARAEIQRASGARECLLDIPHWDFHWQGNYALEKPVQLWNGDKLNVECHWDNSAPGATDRAWGEGTDDEMCLGVFYLTQ